MNNIIPREDLPSLIKKEILIILKKPGFYIICFLLLLNILGRILFNYSLTGINIYVLILATSHESIFLFSIFIIANLFKERYCLSILEKTNKTPYFLSKIFSMYLVIVLVDFIFIISQVIISSFQYGFGFASITAIFLATCLKLLSLLMIITILTSTILFFKNNFFAIFLFIIIIKFPTIVSFLSNLAGLSINLNWLSIGDYLNQICVKNITILPLCIGILLSFFYTILFLILGIYISKKNRPKIDIIRFIGCKYLLIRNLKFLLERATYIYNRISLNASEDEKIIVLGKLREIVVTLTQLLESYNCKEIGISKLNLEYSICLSNYRKLKEDYLIINRFDILSGYGLNYYKFFF